MTTVLFLLIGIPTIGIALLVLWGIDKLIFDVWLGKKNKRFKIFADCSGSWLLYSFNLPGKMKKYWPSRYSPWMT